QPLRTRQRRRLPQRLRPCGTALLPQVRRRLRRLTQRRRLRPSPRRNRVIPRLQPPLRLSLPRAMLRREQQPRPLALSLPRRRRPVPRRRMPRPPARARRRRLARQARRSRALPNRTARAIFMRSRAEPVRSASRRLHRKRLPRPSLLWRPKTRMRLVSNQPPPRTSALRCLTSLALVTAPARRARRRSSSRSHRQGPTPPRWGPGRPEPGQWELPVATPQALVLNGTTPTPPRRVTRHSQAMNTPRTLTARTRNGIHMPSRWSLRARSPTDLTVSRSLPSPNQWRLAAVPNLSALPSCASSRAQCC